MVVHGWIQIQVGLVCTTQYKGRKLGEPTHTVPDFLLLLEDLTAIAWHSAAELSLNLATVPTTPYCLFNFSTYRCACSTVSFFIMLRNNSMNLCPLQKWENNKLEQDSHVVFLHPGGNEREKWKRVRGNPW